MKKMDKYYINLEDISALMACFHKMQMSLVRGGHESDWEDLKNYIVYDIQKTRKYMENIVNSLNINLQVSNVVVDWLRRCKEPDTTPEESEKLFVESSNHRLEFIKKMNKNRFNYFWYYYIEKYKPLNAYSYASNVHFLNNFICILTNKYFLSYQEIIDIYYIFFELEKILDNENPPNMCYAGFRVPISGFYSLLGKRVPNKIDVKIWKHINYFGHHTHYIENAIIKEKDINKIFQKNSVFK